MGAASGYKNSFNPQFLTSSDRRVRQIDPLRDATMLKMLDEIARDDTFRIEGMKKGTEKAVFENVTTIKISWRDLSKNDFERFCQILPYRMQNITIMFIFEIRCIQMSMLMTRENGSKCSS